MNGGFQCDVFQVDAFQNVCSGDLVQTVVQSGVRRRYVEFDNRLIEVEDVEEAKELLKKLRQSERIIKKQEKRLKILVRKTEVDLRTHADYRSVEVAKVESRKVELLLAEQYALYEQILDKLNQYDDEEDEWMMLN